MRQVAEVTEHATILIGASLACLVALVAGMRADKGEDALDDWKRQMG
jgi:enterochelin esterase-like enzyme